MNIRLIVAVLLGIAVVGIGSGCRSARVRTQKEDERTGLFGNDPFLTATAFTNVVEGKTTVEALHEIGFDVNAHNVGHAEGPNAFQSFYGPNSIHDTLKNLAEGVTEYGDYKYFRFPLVIMTNVSDRIYWHKEVTHRNGTRKDYIFLIRGNLVIKKTSNGGDIDTTSVSRAVFQGPVKLIGEVGGAVKFLQP